MENSKHFYSNPGSPIKVTYGSRIDKLGNIIVEEKGKENLYDYIQSFAESCDINNIIKKFESGDLNALNQRKGEFMDLTEMPTDYFEMVNTINEAKYKFERLPIEVKQKFDNDPNKFIATIGTGDWYLKLFNEKKNDEVKTEKVVTDEVKEGVSNNE